jgi:hypothetical protein
MYPFSRWTALALCVTGGAAVLNWEQLLVAQAPSSSEAPRRRGELFDPARQKPVRASRNGVEVALVNSHPCARCGSGVQLQFEVGIPKHGTLKQLLLTDGPTQVDEIRILSNSTAAIIGQYMSNVYMIVLVNVDSATVIDKWLCFDPSISPDGTLIVYGKVYPRHFMDGVSTTYLVYQTERSAAENRSAGVPVSDTTNVGLPLYPIGATNVPGDNISVDEGVRHELASDGFFWLDDRKVAFADRSGAFTTVVIADLASGVAAGAAVRAIRLDVDRILTSTGCRDVREQRRERYAFHVSDIRTAGTTQVRVRFRFSQPGCDGLNTLDLDAR